MSEDEKKIEEQKSLDCSEKEMKKDLLSYLKEVKDLNENNKSLEVSQKEFLNNSHSDNAVLKANVKVKDEKKRMTKRTMFGKGKEK